MLRKIMYIYIGNDTVINSNDIIGIFDSDNTTVENLRGSFESKRERRKACKRLYGYSKILYSLQGSRRRKAGLSVSAFTANTEQKK